jgi:hypothetical protein
MTQADTRLSTPPLSTSLSNVANPATDSVDTARRRFLSQAAIVTAGSAALAATIAVPASATAVVPAPDPILEAIEAHKAAHTEFVSWVDRHCKLEKELPSERRQTHITAWEEAIVKTDDPRWIEAEREVSLSSDAKNDAALDLLEVSPTTRAGVLALLDHVAAYDKGRVSWPDDWHPTLLKTLADTLPLLWQEGSAA